jgi:predicted tellurium resistance membrane protein TerC
MLALSFLLLVGMALVADGLDHHIPKGYIYFAMGFSVFVEMLNLRLRQTAAVPVHLRERYPNGEQDQPAAGPHSGSRPGSRADAD